MGKKRHRRSGNSSNANRFSISPGQGNNKRQRATDANSVVSENAFSVLTEQDNTALNVSDLHGFGGTVEEQADSIQEESTRRGSGQKPPPLMVKSVPLDKLVRDLQTAAVVAEFKLCRVGIKVVTHSKEHYDMASAYLKNIKAEYYTHDVQAEKPFKAVIRGLPIMDQADIQAELKNHYKLDPIAVFPMTRREDNMSTRRDCLYLVHFRKGSVTLSALQAVRSLSFIIIRWEAYRGSHRDVTQCQRCLHFGHGTKNCHLKPRCGYCGGSHATSVCTDWHPPSSYRCANCTGAHHGGDRKCPKRAEYKNIRKQASSSNQPGRRRDRGPPFKADDFPELVQQQQQQPPDRAPAWNNQTPPDIAGTGAETSPSSTTPGSQLPPTLSVEQLYSMFATLCEKLQQCQAQMFQVLQAFIQHGR